jgi:hypothetical protein
LRIGCTLGIEYLSQTNVGDDGNAVADDAHMRAAASAGEMREGDERGRVGP